MENRPEFQLLGPFQARKSCGSDIDFGHRKVLALLAYLAVEHERPQTREHLASLLWSRTGDERARHNLRQALSKLRALCPELIQTTADLVSLNQRACSIDVLHFEAAARSGNIDQLQLALDHYRGDLLEGYVAREADYQDWLEVARTRLRKQAEEIARHLTDLLIAEGRDEDAITHLHRLLEFEKADESAHRNLMLLLARNGRRSEALRQYQACVAALEQELDVAPTAETQRLLGEIKDGEPSRRGAVASAEVTTTSKHSDPVRMTVLAMHVSAATGLNDATPVLDLAQQLALALSGEILERTGSTLLAGFDDVGPALQTALDIQSARKEELNNEGLASCRIGLDSGSVSHRQDQWHGDPVNMAQRLAALVQTGDICISASLLDAVGRHQHLEFQFIGEQQARGVTQPVSAYRVGAAHKPAHLQPLSNSEPAIELPGKPSLLLKPFDNISNDTEQDYFVEGLTKDISIALTKIPGLFLTLDETPRAQFSQDKSVKTLGREFGVRFVLCGGVRRHGERVRVDAELIDAASGQCIWGERYDRDLSDLFTIQDEITEEIVTAMDVKLVQGEAARFMRRSLANPAALEASYRGWYALYHGTSHQDVLEAQHLFEQVIDLEPQAPLGYASAALAYWAEAGFGRVVVDSDAMHRAAEFAHKALELGDTTGYANLVLAVEHLAQRDFDQALSQVTEGVAARPNCNGAYAIKSSILNFLGRPQEAIEYAQYAVRLTPVYPAEFPAVLAACYHDSGRFPDAVNAAQMSLQLRNDDIDPMLILSAAKVAMGHLDEAREIATRIKHIEPGFTLEEFAATQPYRDPQDLERLIERLRQAGLPD